MTDNKQTFELIFQEALKLARDDKEHEHYYSKRDFKFISLGKNEISEYLDNYEEGEDDEYLDDIIDSGDFVRVPDFYGDEEKFRKDFSFTMDYNHAFFVDATDKMMSDLYTFLYNIYKARPFDYFADTEYIKNDLSNYGGDLEDAYCCVLGNAGRVYGVSFYIGEEGLESLHGLLKADGEDRNITTLVAFTQKCLTFYFDKPNHADKESRELSKKYLGDKAEEVVLSSLHFDGRSSKQNLISYSTAYLYLAYIEAFMNFFKKYHESNKKYKRFNGGEHISFTFNDETDEVSYKKTYIEEPLFSLNSDFLYSIPGIYKDVKRTSKVYEFKFLTTDQIFNLDEHTSYFAPIALLMNHKTGKIVAMNIVLSMDEDYLDQLFEPLIQSIHEEGMPKHVIVDTFIDAMIADKLFSNQAKIIFGDVERIDMIKDEITKVPEEDKYDA